MSNKSLSLLEKRVEKSTGKKIDELREKTIDEHRASLEREGKQLKFKSYKPFIGRGSMIEKFFTENDINEMLDECLELK